MIRVNLTLTNVGAGVIMSQVSGDVDETGYCRVTDQLLTGRVSSIVARKWAGTTTQRCVFMLLP